MRDFIITSLILILLCSKVYSQSTEKIYLSGSSGDSPKEWEFYCSDGMNSKKWSKIDVPSCWELQGFGEYTYGHVDFKKRKNETGRYRYTFTVPKSWKKREINIVFEGVMTDTEVKINGKKAGKIHQGGFYEFKYNISKLLKYGRKNKLEVFVKKQSDNESINHAERKADYWVFGGIFRPVYLESLPKKNIKHISIDAKANGNFKSQVIINKKGNYKLDISIVSVHGEIISTKSQFFKSDRVEISLKSTKIKQWTSETPNLYNAVFKLKDRKGKTIHQVSEKFGFRTVEVREKDGIYINGIKVKLKGVNRHSFWPSKGRTISKRMSIKDVKLIKEMNMNAVRMSHYPPDRHMLDVCDSLGLYVLDELAGWQRPSYDNETAKRLVKQVIERDVNHPSIIIWDNANEGGWNRTIDNDFQKYDIQKREVIHPWEAFGKFNTLHYFDYNYLAHDSYQRDKLLMPTEFLHGLYDGGHGAGLDDYWRMMWQDPLCAGGFLWVFADESVERTDRNRELDSDGNHAPDGIVGPYHEKEGSFYTIKEVWSPIYIENRHITAQFNGIFNIENRYHFTNLNQCTIKAKWLSLENVSGKSTVKHENLVQIPSIKPGERKQIKIDLPENWSSYDVLLLETRNNNGDEIFTWSYPVKDPKEFNKNIVKNNDDKISVKESDEILFLSNKKLRISFNKATGEIVKIFSDNIEIPLSNGPLAIREDKLKSFNYKNSGNKCQINVSFKKGSKFNWTLHSSGYLELEVFIKNRKIYDNSPSTYRGITFSYPESEVKSMYWIGDGPYRVWRNRMKGTQFGLWGNDYNNTITGYSQKLKYPEFKGFYSNLYQLQLIGKNNNGFKVYCNSENIYLRMLTPDKAEKPRDTHVEFPKGDISFLTSIAPIGTKFKKAEKLGPQSQVRSNYGKDFEPVKIKLVFDFN